MSDNIAEIRGLLEKIEWQKGDYDMGLRGCKICGQMEECGHSKDCELAKLLSLLPPVCECGGSGKVPIDENGIITTMTKPCPACKPTDIEEFVKKMRKRWSALAPHMDSTLDYAISALFTALTHLTAQAKAIKVQDEDIAGFQEDLMKEAKRGDALSKQVKGLEENVKGKQELIDRLCSQEPCPKCGYGVTGACYGCEIKKLRAKIEQNRWIPVGEGLPEDFDRVLVCDHLGKYGIYYCESKWWYPRQREGSLIRTDQITHWQPIILPDQALQKPEAE